MPWRLEQGNPGCRDDQWAVVKTDDGAVEGCHDTEASAQAQLAALYASEDDMAMAQPRGKKPSRFCYRAMEFRAEPTEDGHTLEGYAAVFDSPSRIDSFFGDSFDEVIQRGAFTKTVSERTPVLQFDHGMDSRTGSVPIGAINSLKEDANGLFVSARLFDNPVVEPIRQAVAGGAIDGMSFRFRVMADSWDKRDDDVDLRTIREVELFELGPVVFPAYESTTVGVRAMLAGLDEREREQLVAALTRELRGDAPAADEGTAADPAEAVIDTSGLSPSQRREVLFDFLTERTEEP